MSKQKAPRRVGDNEALAVGTTIRGSAQKLNLVAGLIRGKKVDQALNILKATVYMTLIGPNGLSTVAIISAWRVFTRMKRSTTLSIIWFH